MKDQHKIGFIETSQSEDFIKNCNQKNDIPIDNIADQQKAKKLKNKDNGMMTSRHISTARTGIIKDDGGPSKQIKTEISNSIFDIDKGCRLSGSIDSKTKTNLDKEIIKNNRRTLEQNRMNELANNIKDTIQGKSNSVSSSASFQGSNYKDIKNGFSIFDNQDFQRVPEKTSGEIVSEEISKKRSQKDDSWRGGGKSKTTQEAVGDFFNNLFK